MCEETSRARCSYRRMGEEVFEESTRLLANPLARREDVEDLAGWTLHRLRHIALTHDAENGTSTPMLLARRRGRRGLTASGANQGTNRLAALVGDFAAGLLTVTLRTPRGWGQGCVRCH